MKNRFTDLEIDYITGRAQADYDSCRSITVAEGIAMASRLHAAYNGGVVKRREGVAYEHRIDFDDPSFIVDLTKRNSRNNNGVNVIRGVKGDICDSMLVVDVTEPNSNGVHNPQFVLNGLELCARYYNKIIIRMRIDGDDEEIRKERLNVYFKTNTVSYMSEERCVSAELSSVENTREWFELVIEAGENENWKDYIKSLRFDPPMKKGIYYIDYIVITESKKIKSIKWYDMYLDYAVDNAIIDKYKFTTQTYETHLTSAMFCDLLAAALPEEWYNPINDIKGIPDVSSDTYNSSVYLMLYKAGVLLGLDDEGNLKPDASITLGDASQIAERAALAEKRLKGKVKAETADEICKYNLEYNESPLVLKYDGIKEKPAITLNSVDMQAEDFIKLRIRMKYDLEQQPEKTEIGMYFMTDGDEDFTNEKYVSGDFVRDGYTDPAGWCIAEIDLPMFYVWKGKITAIKIQPACAAGTYKIDYIRFVKAPILLGASHEKLLSLGYKFNGMLQDNGFERGFNIQHFEQKKVDIETRRWQDYCETDKTPLWDVGPWWCSYDLWDNRDLTADKYTLTDDKGINTLKYNPEEKSLTMRVNATKIYNGQPHDVKTYKWWPHLLLNQHYSKYPVDKVKNNAGADRIFLELDIRMSDFKHTINTQGANVCSFLLYFYFITDKAPSEKIWYGFSLFHGNYNSGNFNAFPGTKSGWAPDSAAHQYMYGTPQAVVYGGIEHSFNPAPVLLPRERNGSI